MNNAKMESDQSIGVSNRNYPVRIHSIETVASPYDKLSFKPRLWEGLVTFYGREKASAVMALSYLLDDCTNESSKSNGVASSKKSRESKQKCELDLLQRESANLEFPFYILKDPMVSKQKGLQLVHRDDIAEVCIPFPYFSLICGFFFV
jgi:hypothetical protein